MSARSEEDNGATYSFADLLSSAWKDDKLGTTYSVVGPSRDGFLVWLTVRRGQNLVFGKDRENIDGHAGGSTENRGCLRSSLGAVQASRCT